MLYYKSNGRKELKLDKVLPELPVTPDATPPPAPGEP